MAATVPAASGGADKVLYIRTGSGVLGPYPYESVREMARNGALPPEGAISVDGHTWTRADKELEVTWAYRAESAGKVKGAEERAVAEGYRSADALRTLLERVCSRGAHRRFFNVPVVASVSLLLLVGTLSLLVYGTGLAHAITMKRIVLFMALAIPSSLGVVAILVACGNAFLKASFRLGETERRFLALHLPKAVLNRLGWGILLRNWIYRGEWLFSPSQQSSRAYIHLFRSGPELAGIVDEVALWDGLSRVLPYSLRELCTPGEALRQVQQ
ncbi:MAG: hypothetical protein ACYTGH_20110, partial [Planctomycetota bacterium]